ncbi:HNH endonuclease, partial [Bacteroides caecigallinarum]
TYRIDNTLNEESVEDILRKEEIRCTEREKYCTRKSISDFRSGLRKFLDFLKSDYRKRYDNSILSEIEKIKENQHLSVTEKESIILSRRGQGVFRNNLIKYWDGCAISKCSLTDMLVASHIKPWKDSTNDERLDVFNGLLLLPNYDKLFDLGYLTFTSEGKAIYSKLLSKNDKYLLGLTSTLSLCRIEEAHKTYLKYHNKYCFIG